MEKPGHTTMPRHTEFSAQRNVALRIKPMRQLTGWPVMVCHGCNSEYSTRSVTCVRCRIVAIIDKAQTQQTAHTSQRPGSDGICNPKPGAEWAWCKNCKKQFGIRRRQVLRETVNRHIEEREGHEVSFFNPRSALFPFWLQYPPVQDGMDTVVRLFCDSYLELLEPTEQYTFARTHYRSWLKFVISFREKMLVNERFWEMMEECWFSD